MSSLRAIALDEPVELEEYDPSWSEVFRAEALILHARLGNRAGGIEHIGSTAVPGLLAKPIIDIMLGVPVSILRDATIGSVLTDYEALGEAGIPGRLYFRKRMDHDSNLHVVEYKGLHWVNNLLLRDYLRAHVDEVERYSQIKRDIIGRGIHTLLAYSEAKSRFITDLLTRARGWKP